ncbi:MAG TPA: hypothetical protein VK983_03825 [Candidatus Limnocylindrales bacterium]|nr:hypothetical protein [Candidatus Limnocylindrales bacterium]
MVQKKSSSSEPEITPIEQKVDDYMDISRPTAEPSKAQTGAADLPPIDIFEGKTAPLAAASEATKTDDLPATAPALPASLAVADSEPKAVETSTDQTEVGIPASSGQKAGEERGVPAAAEQPKPDPLNDADPLVDAIVAREGDDVLAAEDDRRQRLLHPEQPSFGQRVRGFFAAWWQNKWARYGTLSVVLLALGAAAVVPTSRYYVLNTAGVRAAASITVFDRTTQLPLKNVQVQIGETKGKTNQQGVVKLQEAKLGTQQLTIERLGFATISRTVTLGLGSNPLGEEQLKAVGVQFRFQLTDLLSGKPVQSAEATSGDVSAQSDKQGEIVLTFGGIEDEQVPVAVAAKGYRTEKVQLAAANKAPTKLAMVVDHRQLYVSKQSGTYDVYKMDVDGKNKQVLLKGTGLEGDRIWLVQHPTEQQAALVSSRQNKRNQDGYLLQTLTLMNAETGDTLTLDTSEEIRVVDWIKNRLVYVKIKAGTSAGNPERFQLMSYDYTTASNIQLATANYFTDVVSARGSIYYTASNNYRGGQSLFGKINPDNTGKQTLLKADIWNILRAGPATLHLSGQSGWYGYALGEGEAKKLPTPPANTNESRYYLDGPDGKTSLWTDNRDGKGVLLKYDQTTKKDTVITTQSGLGFPVKWLGEQVVVYRVVTPGETADYAISLQGGEPRKLADVTNTAGFGRWLYY